MCRYPTSLTVAAAALALAITASDAPAAELIYGNWTPAQEYQNRVVMPELFKNIDAGHKGAIKWKLIAGGQIADGKTTFTAVKDGLMQAGLGIVTYVPNALPSVYAIYSTIIFGENDPVAATLAALETMYLHCPSCLEEAKKIQCRPARRLDQSAYMLACREPFATFADLKGKRVRATGGNAEMLKAGRHGAGRRHPGRGGRPAAARRSRLPARHPRLAAHLRLRRRRQVRDGLSARHLGAGDRLLHEPRHLERASRRSRRRSMLKHAAWLSAKMAIGNFIVSNEKSLETVIKDKGVQLVEGRQGVRSDRGAVPRRCSATTNIATAKNFGVKDPAAIIDTYEKAVESWRPVSKEIGRDIDKFTDLLNREIFSKVDPDKL